MKKIFANTDLAFYDYQKVSFFNDIRLKFADKTWRPAVLHTRDYVFSKHLAKEWLPADKLYTRFGIFYVHCALMYEALPRGNRKGFSEEVARFNKHWGMLMFETKPDWKIYSELQRIWAECRVNLIKGKWKDTVYEIEDTENEGEMLGKIDSLRKRILEIGDVRHIDWMEVK